MEFRSCLLYLTKDEFRNFQAIGITFSRKWAHSSHTRVTKIRFCWGSEGVKLIEASQSLHTPTRQASRHEENIAGVRSG